MKNFVKLNVFLAIMMVVGLSLAIIGCEKASPTEPSTVVGQVPTPAPQPEPEDPSILLDTTVSLNGNAMCYNGSDFCADHLTFVLSQAGKAVTIRATGPSNTDPDVVIFTSAGTYVTGGESAHPGSEIVTFTPVQTDVYRVRVYDYKKVGGSVHVTVTQ